MQDDNPIFTMESISGIEDRKLLYILKPACIAAMQGDDPIFTIESLSSIDIEKLPYIATSDCIMAIEEGRVTLEQLAEMEITELQDTIQTDDYPSQTDDYPRQGNYIRGKS